MFWNIKDEASSAISVGVSVLFFRLKVKGLIWLLHNKKIAFKKCTHLHFPVNLLGVIDTFNGSAWSRVEKVRNNCGHHR